MPETAPGRGLAAASPSGSAGPRATDGEQGPAFVPEDRFATVSLDRAFKAHLARFTLGITPAGLASTLFEWWAHLLISPGKQGLLVEKAARKLARLMIYAVAHAGDRETHPCIDPLAHDKRFRDPAWCTPPYDLIYQSFLLTQQWWHNATTEIDGLSEADERVVSFVARQILDHFSPSNFVATNPVVARATLEQGGLNLVRGWQNLLEDWERAVSGKPPVGAERFRPGETVAVTPGRVVFRNRLIELIQYEPTTAQVHAEPILIVPAWIMKYYILDLSPHNSLVRYLVEQGFTVFMISWRNPDAEDRDLGMDDYLEQGVLAALEAVEAIVPRHRVHAVGYCIGGTLLSIAAATLARERSRRQRRRLASLTFFATQTDFTEAGELMLFVRESQVSFLENVMWDQGCLDTKQMAGAFQLLRSTDLIWSRYVQEYLLGRRQDMFDLMAWNADATRMPYRMHSEYLRRIYLANQLAQGNYLVGGKPVTLGDIREPIFAVSTTSDHVAPWRSVYKIHLLTDTELTFALTTGGHNAGIVSEPGHDRRSFQIRTSPQHEIYVPPDDWVERTPSQTGSWWPAWVEWLKGHSTGPVEPPAMGAPDRGYAPGLTAPGSYVLQR